MDIIPFVRIALLILVAASTAVAQNRLLPADPPSRLDPVLAGTLKVRLTKAALENNAANVVLQRLGLVIVRPLLRPDQSLQWRHDQRAMRDGQTTMQDGALESHNTLLNIDEVLRLEDELLRSFVVSFSDTLVAPERMCSWLRPGCSDIEVAEPFYVARLTGMHQDGITAEPNDTLRSSQPMLALIRVFEAWDIEDGEDSVLIGISDSGILQTHEDLKDALHINTQEVPSNNLDDDGNGYIDDYNGYNFCTADDGTPPGNTHNPREGHGTGVAGICGATVNNGVGIAGIANKCKLVPLKTMPDDVGGIVYGYESMIYCAVNGIDVINCSWGSQSRSCIDENVVQYTIARGVAVVAAAGNHASAAPFFPAAYKGVLGVGVTDELDGVVGMSCVGPTVDLMAPGQGTFTTSSNGGYGSFCCTSGAAPIVSGVVGLIRAKHPELSPLEACALAREAVANSPWTHIPDDKTPELLPRGRLDAFLAVTVKPDSVPSVEVDTVRLATTSDDTRWTVGDTIYATLEMRNILATWTPSSVSVDLAPFRPLLDLGLTAIGSPITPEGTVLTKGAPFSVTVPLLVTKDTDTSTFIRLLLESSAGARTQVLAAVTPAPAFRVLRNDVLALSVGDNARVGNVDIDRGQGSGLTYRGFCGQLYEGGLMISSAARVVDAVRAERGTHDYFLPIKKFTHPEQFRGIVRDDKAPDSLRIGIEVQQDVRIAGGDSGVYVSDITIKNVSDSTLHDVAVGWFLDWDLGTQPAKNRTELITYDTRRHLGIQGAWSVNPGEPYVACAAISNHSDAIPISTGFDNSDTYGGFSVRSKDSLMRYGGQIQEPEEVDVAVVSGMRFTSFIPPGGVRSFRIVWSLDLIRDSAISHLSRQIENPAPNGTTVSLPYPNPADDHLSFSITSQETTVANVDVFDMQGRRVLESQVDISPGDNIVHIDLRGVGVGMYAVRASTSSVQRFVFWRR